MVIGDGVQRPLVDPAGVVPVDDLAHEPEFRLHLIRHTAQRSHIVEIQHIRRVQPYAVDIELPDPEPHHVADIVPHRGIVLVELGQQIVAAPVLIGEAVVVLVVPPEIHVAVPVLIRGILPLLPDVPEGEEVPPRMVEHAVQDDPDSLPVALRHILRQILVGAQAAVQLFVVRGLISMPHGLEQGPDINRVAADFLYVGYPGNQSVQPVHRLCVRILPGRSGEPQGIDMVKYRLIVPCHVAFPPV